MFRQEVGLTDVVNMPQVAQERAESLQQQVAAAQQAALEGQQAAVQHRQEAAAAARRVMQVGGAGGRGSLQFGQWGLVFSV